MPDPRDFLPQLPWEGPPIPRRLIRSKKRVEPVCAVCGRAFEDYRSGEEKMLDAIFGTTYCPEHREKEE